MKLHYNRNKKRIKYSNKDEDEFIKYTIAYLFSEWHLIRNGKLLFSDKKLSSVYYWSAWNDHYEFDKT